MAKDAGKSLGDAQTRLRESEQLKSGLDTARSLGDSQTLIGGLAGDAGELNDGLELTDLLARYTIIKTLGQGGMGEVLLATDNRLKRQVAIKRIRGEQAKSRAAVQRFLTEAQAIAALNHPNIVQVYDYGRDQEGPFLIMEYVDGQSLLERCKDNPLPVDEAVELTCELLGGLGRAHELGIVHRDIKPANILLTKDGRPKLTDFGLAKQTSADHGQTVAGAVLGTIDFMPPEQRRDATLVDARSDLWSLAATLYQMLTGKSPKVIRLDLLPKHLVGVIGQALEESPAQRFQSAAAFRDALRGSNQTETLGASELIAGQCPQCGTRNSETVRFCRECSAALKVPCLGCEAEIPIWDKGCTECGARQADLFERKRGELQKLQTEVERLREAGKVAEALRRLESVGDVKHPRLQDFRHWVERALPDLREQSERLVKLSGDALAEAQAHRAAWDYPAAIRTLKSLPPEARGEAHKTLLAQLSSDWTELQQKLQEIQQRVKAKQLDGLLPLVERAVELRGNREDLKKLLGQLQQREAMLAASPPRPLSDPLSEPFEAATGSVTLPGFLGKAKPQQTVLQQRGPLIAAAAGGLLLLLFFGWLFSRGGGNADSASTTEKIASANRPGVLAPKQSSEMSQSVNASAKQVAPPSKTTPSNTSPASPFFSQRSNSDKAGSKENLNSIGMKLKLVPAGSFTMGTGAEAHQVKLTKPFYLGAYEVTTAQYAKVMGKGADQDSRDLPMAYVSWEEATEFCRKLSELPDEKKAGRVYRLPTEAEWEYACRAGTTTKYCNGDSQWDLANYAWFEANSSVKTHAVGTKKANAWGFYDMHGNVWEWCYDLYGEYPKGAVTDPTGPVRGKNRVLRGGSWSVTAEKCASAYRDSNLPSSQFFTYGFRVAVTLPEEGK